VFVQFEFPWALGPPDGRYLLRAEANGEPVRVLVLGTLDAARAARARPGLSSAGRLRGRSAVRRRNVAAQPDPAAVATARATIIDPVSLSAERQAQAWLADLDADREVSTAVAVLNRVLHAQRIAAADPYAHEVSPAQALVIRAGWGEGEQVADGRWLRAVELSPAKPRARRRKRREAALRSEDRLAGLLGARDHPLLCEEIALRARTDLDQGRIAHAALELDHAYAAALPELRAEGRPELGTRIAELEQLRDQVAAQAQAVFARANGSGDTRPETGEHASRPSGHADEPHDAAARPHDGAPGQLEDATLRQALERLEAALRARAAAGPGRS
jgi:hypothetical protein